LYGVGKHGEFTSTSDQPKIALVAAFFISGSVAGLKNQKGTEPEAFPGPGGVLPDQPVVKMILIWMAKHGCLYVYTAY
jgi:hypothetical protein